MSDLKIHPIHTISQIELLSDNPKVAERFYTQLLAIKAKDEDFDKTRVHTLLHKQGKRIGLIRRLPEAVKSQGVSNTWVPYISVTDVDATAKHITRQGGKIILEPMNIRGFARLGLASDPEGGLFYIWKPQPRMGFDIINEPGAYCWSELYFNNRDQQISFYTDIFGWQTKVEKMPDGTDYTMFVKGDVQVAGAMKIEKEWKEMPPCWMVYLTVENCKVAAERAKVLKAEVEMEPTKAGDMGWFAVLSDPHGAYFNIMEFVKKEEVSKEPERKKVKH